MFLGWSVLLLNRRDERRFSFFCYARRTLGRARLDRLEGGTHEETLRPQVNPKVLVSRVPRFEGLKPIA